MFDNFCQFLENSPMFKENLPKKGPLLREFWIDEITIPKPNPRHFMLPLPPGKRSKRLTVCVSIDNLFYEIKVNEVK